MDTADARISTRQCSDLGKPLLQVKVELTVDGVNLVISSGRLCIGRDLFCSPDGGLARFLNRFPDSRSAARQESHSVSRSLAGVGQHYGRLVDVSLELPPEFAARASAREPDLADRDVHLTHDLQG